MPTNLPPPPPSPPHHVLPPPPPPPPPPPLSPRSNKIAPPIPPKSSTFTINNKIQEINLNDHSFLTNTTHENESDKKGPTAATVSQHDELNSSNGEKSKIENIKRKKTKENKRMTETEAKKILSSMVALGDPYNKYDLKDKLGSGAAGEVYRAVNKQTGIQVAIKRMLLEKQQRKDLIITEIQGKIVKIEQG